MATTCFLDDVDELIDLNRDADRSTEREPEFADETNRSVWVQFADGLDLLLVCVGLSSSVLLGFTKVFMMIFLSGMLSNTMTVPVVNVNSTKVIVDTSSAEYASRFAAKMRALALKLLLLSVFSVSLAVLQHLALMRTAERRTRRMSKAMFRHVLRRDIAWFDQTDTGQISTLFSERMEVIRDGIGEKLGITLNYVFTALSGVVCGFIYAWQVAASISAILVFALVFKSCMLRTVRKLAKREAAEAAKLWAMSTEVLSGIRTIQSFNGQPIEYKNFNGIIERVVRHATLQEMVEATIMATSQASNMLSAGVGMWVAAELVLTGVYDAGEISMPLLSLNRAILCIAMGLTYYFRVAQSFPAMRAIRGVIIGTKSDKSKRHETIEGAREITKGTVEFRNVHFKYPNRDTEVLSNVSFTANMGESIAMVGPSGSGKSTIIKLLLRFYQPISGQILIDNVDINDYEPEQLQKTIGLVSQEPVLFNTTIMENIKLGGIHLAEPPSKADVVAAARKANAHGFISALPKTFDTHVGARGAQLSGGQKQRVAIARALIRQPKILLLDEATSALDSRNEKTVQEALNDAQKGRTTVTIAHRLSTIWQADKILVLDQGSIRESGTHEELMRAAGLYYQLVKNQDLESVAGQVEQAGDNNSLDYHDSMGTEEEEEIGILQELDDEDGSVISGMSGKKKRKLAREGLKEEERLRRDLAAENLQPVSYRSIFCRAATVERELIVCGLLGSVLMGSSSTFGSYYIGSFFTALSDADTFVNNRLQIIVCIMVAISGVKLLSTFFTLFCFGRASEKICCKIRQELYWSLLNQDGRFFDDIRHGAGTLVSRLSLDVSNVKLSLGSHFAMLLTLLTGLVSAMTLAVVLELPSLSLVVIGILISVPAIIVGRNSAKGGRQKQVAKQDSANHVLTEAVENIQTVRALGCEEVVYRQYCAHLDEAAAAGRADEWRHGLSYGVFLAATSANLAAVFLVGSLLVSVLGSDPMNVFLVIIIVFFSTMGVGQAGSFFPDVAKAKFSAALLKQLLREEPIVQADAGTGRKMKLTGEIGFERVSFAYPMRPDARVLNQLQLHMAAGATVALVGASGSGKSTIIALIERFYDPTGGKITFNSVNSKDLNVPHLRSHIATVSQEPILFNRSIAENIALGLEDVSFEKIRQAAVEANAHEFITQLPQGYETVAGERGGLLSGGQKQRVAIARATVREPTILCLDEATAALDTESERLIQEALDRARQGRTCILIAHRLSTVQTADRIVVMQDGAVVEQGSHEELMMLRQRYYDMVQQQNIQAAL